MQNHRLALPGRELTHQGFHVEALLDGGSAAGCLRFLIVFLAERSRPARCVASLAAGAIEHDGEQPRPHRPPVQIERLPTAPRADEGFLDDVVRAR